MQSKTSFFNKALFTRNLKRTWVVGAVLFAFLFITTPLAYLLAVSGPYAVDLVTGYTPGYYLLSVLNTSNNAFVLSFFVIAAAMVTFNYLYNKRDCYMMHSFPVCRKCLYFTGLLTTAIVLVAPVILTALITTIAAAATGAGFFSAIWYTCLIQLGAIVIALGIAMFTLMISGQAVTTIIFYFIFSYMFIMMETVMRYLAQTVLFGMGSALNTMKFTALTPTMYITNNCYVGYDNEWSENGNTIIRTTMELNGGKALLLYTLVGLVLMVAAYLLYKAKKLETVQDFITVPVMKYIFTGGISFFTSVMVGAFLAAMFQSSGIGYKGSFAIIIGVTLVLGIIIFYIAQMLIAKTVRVFKKKTALGCGLYTVLALAVILCLRFDVFNIEDYTPAASDVQWAGIQITGTQVYTDADDIERIIGLHQGLLADKDEMRDMAYSIYTGDGAYNNYVTIKYKLNNGKLVQRNYYLYTLDVFSGSEAYAAALHNITDFMNQPEHIKEHNIWSAWDSSQITSMSFSTVTFNENDKTFDYNSVDMSEFTQSEMEEKYAAIYEGLLKDIDECHVLQETFDTSNSYNSNYVNDFYINLKSQDPVILDTDFFEDYVYARYENTKGTTNNSLYISLNANCTNTLAALKECGFFYSDDQLFTNEEVNAYYDSQNDYL